jgi:hypothetical protein
MDWTMQGGTAEKPQENEKRIVRKLGEKGLTNCHAAAAAA